jgi:hypothetical protein
MKGKIIEKDFFDYTGLSEGSVNGVIGTPKPKKANIKFSLKFIFAFIIVAIIVIGLSLLFTL